MCSEQYLAWFFFVLFSSVPKATHCLINFKLTKLPDLSHFVFQLKSCSYLVQSYINVFQISQCVLDLAVALEQTSRITLPVGAAEWIDVQRVFNVLDARYYAAWWSCHVNFMLSEDSSKRHENSFWCLICLLRSLWKISVCKYLLWIHGSDRSGHSSLPVLQFQIITIKQPSFRVFVNVNLMVYFIW